MPQLSLYLDAEILTKIEIAARINNTSISKWVSDRLKESLANNWPENFESLFGSIKDESFGKEEIKDFSKDLKREKL